MNNKEFTRALTRLDITPLGDTQGQTHVPAWRMRCKHLLEHPLLQMFSMTSTIFALCALDVQRLLLPPVTDGIIQAMLSGVFFFFGLELALAIGADPAQWKSLFFWLDVIATFSLVPDLPWMMDFLTQLFQGTGQSADSLTVARAGRAARVGARAGKTGKMVRLVKLARILRVLKMFRVLFGVLHDATAPAVSSVGKHEQRETTQDVIPETMGTAITNTVSKRVVVFVLLAIVIASSLSYYEVDRAEELAFRLLYSSANASAALQIVDEMMHDTLVYAIVDYNVALDRREQYDYDSLRDDETRRYVQAGSTGCEATFLVRPQLVEQAWLNLGLVVSIIVLLSASSFILSKDAVSVVQHPMQQVMRATTATAALLDVFKAVSDSQRSDKIEDLINVITLALHKVLQADSARLFFLDEATDMLWCQMNKDKGSEKPDVGENSFMKKRFLCDHDLRIPIGCGAVGLAALKNATINEVYDENCQTRSGASLCFVNQSGHQIKVRNELCMPIRADNKTIGVVQVINKKSHTEFNANSNGGFDSLDERLLQTFCSQVSGVIKTKSIAAQYQSATNQGSVGVQDLLSTFASTTTKAMSTRRRSLQKAAIDAIMTDERQSLIPGGGSSVSSAGAISIPHHVSSMEPVYGWGFPCFDYTPEQLTVYTTRLFTDLGLLAQFNIEASTMSRFVAEVARRYNEVPYHNFYHAFSVFQSCVWFCAKTTKGEQLSAIQKLSMLVASLCHDCGHTGVNNQFAIHNRSELATLYNDLSPLENLHAWSCFDAMKTADIFAGLTKDQKSQARCTIVKSILATDMAFHKEKLEKISTRHDLSGDFLIGVVLHTMDIGSTAYPWRECVRWSRCVGAEFAAQVALEKKAKLPVSTFMDIAGDLDLARLQADFIAYIVLPAFNLLHTYVPQIGIAVRHLKINRDKFISVTKHEIELPSPNEEDSRKLLWAANVASTGVGSIFQRTPR